MYIQAFYFQHKHRVSVSQSFDLSTLPVITNAVKLLTTC